jgi:hypothetical protein
MQVLVQETRETIKQRRPLLWLQRVLFSRLDLALCVVVGGGSTRFEKTGMELARSADL